MAIGSSLIIKILGDITDFKSKIKETEGYINNTANIMTGFGQKGEAGYAKMADGLVGLGGNMVSTGVVLTKHLALPLAAALTAGLAAAISYEDAFAGVRKTVDATAEEFAQLNSAIIDMSRNLPLSANEIARVMEIAGQLGIKTGDLEGFTRVMVDMGVATDLTAENAATQLARFATIMGTESSQFENLGSTVVDLGNNFATTEPEIVNMALAIAGTGKQMGMTEADIFGVATALTSIGINAERGGTSISKWLTSMKVASTVGVKSMSEIETATGKTHKELAWMAATNSKDFNELAISIGKTPKELKTVVEAGTDLQKMAEVAGMSMAEFSDIVENDAAEALNVFLQGLASGNVEGDTAIEMLTAMGVTQERLRDTLLRTGGAGTLFADAIEMGNKAFKENTALQEEAELRYETAGSQLTMMKNSFFALANELGTHMLPMFKDIVKWLNNMAKSMSEMNPRTMELIVKAMTSLVVIIPGMVLAGKAIGGIGHAMKGYQKAAGVWSKFQEFTKFNEKSKLFVMDAKSIEGGWTELAMTMAGVRPNAAGNLYGPTASGGMGGVKKMMSEYNADMEAAGKSTKVFSESMVNAGGSATKLTQTPLFKGIATGGILLALGLYLKYVYDNSEDFRRGLDKLMGVVKKIGEAFKIFLSPIKDVALGLLSIIAPGEKAQTILTDIALVVGGLFTLLILNNPIGWVITAVGLLVGGLKLLGLETEYVSEKQQLYNSVANDTKERIENLSLPIDKITNEHMPALIDKFEEAFAVFDEEGALIKGATLEETKARLETFATDTETYMDEHHGQMVSDQQEYHELLNMEGTTRAKSEAKNLEQMHTHEKTQVAAIISDIQTLEEKALTEKGFLDEREVLEREALYHKLDMLALNRVTVEEKRDLASKARLMKKLKETGELTEAEWENLNEIEQRGWDKTQDIMDIETGNRIAILDKMVEQGLVLEENYQTELDKIMETSAQDQAAVSTKHFATEFEKLTGASLAKYKEYEEVATFNEKWDRKETDRKNGIYNELNTMDATQLKKKREWADKFTEENGEVTLSTEDLGKVMGIFSKDTTQFFVETASGMKLTGAAQELLKQFGIDITKVLPGFSLQGGYIARGMESGIIGNIWRVESASRKMAAAAERAGAGRLEMKSPSRVFVRMGAFVAEGLAMGIDANSHKAADSVKDMANEISKQDFALDTSTAQDIQRKVTTQYQIKANNQLAASMEATRQQSVSLAAVGKSMSNGLVDYKKLGAEVKRAMLGTKFELDNDGFVRMIDDRLLEVI